MTLKIWVDNCSFLEKPAAQDRHWHRKGVFNTISLLRENFLWRCFSLPFTEQLWYRSWVKVWNFHQREIYLHLFDSNPSHKCPAMEKRELVKLFIETMRSLRSLSIHRHDIQAVKKRNVLLKTTSAGCEFYFTLHSMCTDWHLNKQRPF